MGDELKVSSAGRALVYAFAADSESAILSVGHAADGAFWLDKAGHWQTSSYYAPAPTWLRAEPAARNAHGAPASNDDVVTASLSALAATPLGQDDNTDLICLTLSAGKADGKPVRQWQDEMESVYLQLDNTLQRLISGVGQRVPLDRVLFVVTSTGYTEESATDPGKYRIPTGTFYINRTANLLNIYLGAVYGQGRYVEQTFGNQMYLNHKLIEQKRIGMTDILGRSQEFLVQNAGVADVYTSVRLLDGGSDILKYRNGFRPTLSGDIAIEVAPGWKLLNEDTQQTYTSRAGFMPFPIIFMGPGAQPGHVATPVTVDRIAPTVAKAIRIRAPNACNAAPLF